MAQIVNADGATVIGTIAQIAEFLTLVGKAGVLNLDRANFVILEKSLTKESLATAIKATPKRGR